MIEPSNRVKVVFTQQPHSEFMKGLREFCDENDMLLLIDDSSDKDGVVQVQ